METRRPEFGIALRRSQGARHPSPRRVQIGIADPGGAALYNWYAHGELKAEGTSITEGIGQGRITRNLEGAPIDEAIQVSDAEACRVVLDRKSVV